MSASDIFLSVVRWLHLVAAATWVGGSLFYLLVLGPALRRTQTAPKVLTIGAAAEFRTLVNTCIVVLVATGVILAFDRLGSGVADPPYVVTLGVKSALSVWMFLLVQAQQRRSRVLAPFLDKSQQAATTVGRFTHSLSGYNALVIIGLVVFFLSDLLKVLFELSLSRG